jgi:hypothetical protein
MHETPALCDEYSADALSSLENLIYEAEHRVWFLIESGRTI